MVTQERPRVRPAGDWRPRPTLTGADYSSQAVYDEERERLFFGGWVCIGRADEVAAPGDYLVRDLAGESVFVVRNRDGELRAFYNVCAHRGTKLLDDEPGLRPRSARPSSARTTPGRTTSTAGSSRRPTSTRTSSFERVRLPAPPDRGRRARGLPVRQPRRASRGRSTRRSATATRRSPTSSATGWASCASAAGSRTTSPRTGRSSSRTTTSASTARRSTPSSSRSCRSSGRARSGTARRATAAT